MLSPHLGTMGSSLQQGTPDAQVKLQGSSVLHWEGGQPAKPFLLQMCSPCSCASTCLSLLLDNPQEAETLPLLFSPGFELCFLWVQAGLWSEPGDSGSCFIVSVPCISLPQAGPFSKQLRLVREGATFAQHRPHPHLVPES